MNDLRKELLEEVNGDEEKIIRDRIRLLGNVRSCYIISEDAALDGKTLDVDTALLKATGGYQQATILVFGDAAMIYCTGEPPKNTWISRLI